MEFQEFLDDVPLFILFLITITLMIAFIELGFRLAQRHQGKPNKSRLAQVRAITGVWSGYKTAWARLTQNNRMPRSKRVNFLHTSYF